MRCKRCGRELAGASRVCGYCAYLVDGEIGLPSSDGEEDLVVVVANYDEISELHEAGAARLAQRDYEGAISTYHEILALDSENTSALEKIASADRLQIRARRLTALRRITKYAVAALILVSVATVALRSTQQERPEATGGPALAAVSVTSEVPAVQPAADPPSELVLPLAASEPASSSTQLPDDEGAIDEASDPSHEGERRSSTWVVARGDTLSSIAKSCYGSSGKWRLILAANAHIDPRRLAPGQKLVIPGGETQVASARPVADESVKPERYVVKPGDTLMTIATRMYGDIECWIKIYEANKEQLPKTRTVLAGTTLRLPD